MRYIADVNVLEVEIDEADIVYSELDALESIVLDEYGDKILANCINIVKSYYVEYKSKKKALED